MKKYIQPIIILILCVLLFKCCTKKPVDTKEIIIKETIKVFDTVYKIKHDTIDRKNPINKKLIAENNEPQKKYNKATPEGKDSIYAEAISIKDFSHTFEDSLSKVDVNGQVRGEVLNMFATVTLKERKIPITQSEVKYRVLAGGLIQQSDKTQYNALLGFQSKKGHIYLGGYSKINGTDVYSGGALINVFTRKR